ncbi:E3 ubiquitin-protein ligase trul-1-like [Mercenaria mercenaria]|uniref:E3 ubiquitin-protein ligase trul-1-like n=1 Tax=Mercenaria mercenaria TaxID=6596 RepID=UPI00234EEE1A|nr:E3 ubiquitin-protein ligase trul-1-like [Mercenaria mercenaria]
MEGTESDLPLFVPLAPLNDYFQCSICMCNLTVSTMTVCGHRYCEKCISEWVNRQHKCPCCNHPLTTSQLIKDHQFDSLISTIGGEKEKAESKYFENLITEAAMPEGGSSRNMTPVEAVLKEHLKKGLMEHENYFQTLKKSFETKMTVLETTTEKAVMELSSHGLSDQEVTLQTQDLRITLQRQKEELHRELDRCAQMVAETYDKYLSSHIPSLDVLPVKATVILASKNIQIPDIVFDPTDSLKQVRDNVESAMIKKHNPVHEWQQDVRMFLFGPFAKCSECEMEKIVNDYLTTGVLIQDVQVITEGCMLGLQYAMKPGSVILIYGTVKLESDLPKKCFVEVFKKGDTSQRVDYFSCNNCSFKWICRSCMEVCHSGHDVVPYIMQHQPNWACCYCPKKKVCRIQTTG